MNKVEQIRSRVEARMNEFPDIAENIGADLKVADMTTEEVQVMLSVLGSRMNKMHAVWSCARGNDKRQMASFMDEDMYTILVLEAALNA